MLEFWVQELPPGLWAYKLAWPEGDLFVPLTGGHGYPADATAQCRHRGAHDAPDPRCTCGFHALSSRRLPGLPVCAGFTVLTVALSGRVLAFEWAGEGVLWRAQRQTVVRIKRPGLFDRETLRGYIAQVGEQTPVSGKRRHPYDPDGRLASVLPDAPRDSGPVRLDLPVDLQAPAFQKLM